MYVLSFQFNFKQASSPFFFLAFLSSEHLQQTNKQTSYKFFFYPFELYINPLQIILPILQSINIILKDLEHSL